METPQLQSVEILVGDGGRLAVDLPTSQAGLANYVQKINWRREGYGKHAYEIVREGWDDFLNSTVASGVEVVQLHEGRRPNGATVAIAVGSNGTIYYYNFDTVAWVSIGTGYSQPPSESRWQIINVGPYVVFNNAVDLPFTWLVGESAVSPIHELREQGVAKVGAIWEVNQIMMCGDIYEIEDLEAVMTGGTPYGPLTTGIERVQYKLLWSNTGDPRDFAAVVDGNATSGSPTLTLDWALLSLAVGDEITIVGAGPSGGNLITEISAIAGNVITLAENATMTIAGTTVSKTSALNSVVGFYELEDDGSPILCGLPLQNRIVIYKAGSIFVGYYTGDIDEPFVFERQYSGSRTPRYRWTLIDVGSKYHWYAGDKHFYRFSLGRPEPEIDPVMAECERNLFFDVVGNSAEGTVFAADNACTNEVWVWPGTTASVIAYDYDHGCCSTVSGATFQCATTIHRPAAGKTCIERELWFIMGDNDGPVAKYGKTNLSVENYRRYGSAYTCTLRSGMGDFGDAFNEKDVRSWGILSAHERTESSSGPVTTFTLLGLDRNNQTASTLETKVIENQNTPTMVPLHYRKMYFQEQVAVAPSSEVASALTFQGRVWEVKRVRSRSITRIT